jgi:phage baseplate assembly protein W
MAFKQTNIFPIDQQPRNAVGLAYPFSTAFDQEQLQTLSLPSASLAGDVPFKLNYTTSDQLKSNIVTFFSTKKGERFLNPNYGSNISNYLFEQITNDTAGGIEQLVTDELALNFPQLNLKSLEILQSADEQQMVVVLSYTVFNNEENTLEINFNA